MGVYLRGPHLGPIGTGARLSGRKNSGGGCLGIFVFVIVLGLAVQYWYVVLPVTAVVLAVYIPARMKAVRQQQAAQAIADREARAAALEAAEVRTMRQSVEVARRSSSTAGPGTRW